LDSVAAVATAVWRWIAVHPETPRRTFFRPDRFATEAQAAERVRQHREQSNQTLCFCSRPFVLCGLPVSRFPNYQLIYERRKGKLVVQVTGNPEFAVPFGQDLCVAKLASAPEIRDFRGRPLQFVDRFSLPSSRSISVVYRGGIAAVSFAQAYGVAARSCEDSGVCPRFLPTHLQLSLREFHR